MPVGVVNSVWWLLINVALLFWSHDDLNRKMTYREKMLEMGTIKDKMRTPTVSDMYPLNFISHLQV